ncbi:hypothetical protein FUAX_00400 [Fulvitalea axinellae]|nr:hypothetical protein FUAX_00400 [Fulvitalea axinellae]
MVLEVLHRLNFLNKLVFRYILFDTWFTASDTLKYIHYKLKKVFVCPLKSNRNIAMSEKDKNEGKFIHVSDAPIESGQVKRVWVKGVDFPVTLAKQVFTNRDRSTAEQWLVTNGENMAFEDIVAIYQKRWKVEEFHKSLKQNTMLGKSPTKMEITQLNHIFASMIAYIKLEKLKVKEKLNHFAIKSKLYLKMIKAAMEELDALRSA